MLDRNSLIPCCFSVVAIICRRGCCSRKGPTPVLVEDDRLTRTASCAKEQGARSNQGNSSSTTAIGKLDEGLPTVR